MVATSVGQAWVLWWRKLLTEHTEDFSLLAEFIRGQKLNAAVTQNCGEAGENSTTSLWKTPQGVVKSHQYFCKDLQINPIALEVLKKCLKGEGVNLHIVDWEIEEEKSPKTKS